MSGHRPFLILAAVVAVISAGIQLVGILAQTETDSVDARFDLRGDRPARSDIALVLVDDVTFSELREQWPFPRRMHAQLIDRLRRSGARLIAYDVSFDQPERGCHPDRNPDAAACDGDADLLDAAAAARPAVFAVTTIDPGRGPGLFGGGPIIGEVGARPGTVLLATGRGGEVASMLWGDGGNPSFATAAADVLRGRRIGPSAFPDSGRGLIAYTGGAGHYPAFSFSRVLRGRVPAADFRGKTVIVGVEDPRLQDLHPTPVTGAGSMTGAEIQANAIATLLDDFPLRRTPPWADALLAALLGALVPAAAAIGFRRALGVAAVLGAGWPLLSLWQFSTGTVLPVAAPLAGLSLGLVGTVGVQALTQSMQRAMTRQTFERFVGTAVVDDVLRQAGGGGVGLGGQRVQATVLFSDLRGFTAFAEGLEPDEVLAVLNHYLTQMSDAILDHGGTLVAYMGDGIMAVFGAPIGQADHAERALAAASEMVGPALTRCNDWARTRGHAGNFMMGVGLNTGTVMSGTVGSKRRMEYTALGDTTNTASRIEALTKGLGYPVIVSDATWSAVKNPPRAVDLGEHRIRGRSQLIRLWGVGEPMASVTPITPPSQ